MKYNYRRLPVGRTNMKNAYHFFVAGRPAMGNTLQAKSTTISTWYELNYNNDGEQNYPSIDDPQWVDNIYIVINDY